MNGIFQSFRGWCRWVGISLALAVSAVAVAADIDIYANPSASSGAPRILFVIDTGANFSASAATPCTAYSAAAGGGAPSLGATGGGIEQCALVDSIAALPDDRVEIGILVNNNNNFATDVRSESDAAYHEVCQGSAGGCVIRPFKLMTAANKLALINFIKSWKLSGPNSATEFTVKSGGDATASMMQEAWAYFNGKLGMSGKNYGTSLLGGSCQRGYIIFIGNSLNNSGGPADSATPSPDNATTGLRSSQVGATSAQLQKITDTVTFPSTTCGVTSLAAGNAASDWSNNWADEWARLMYQQDASSSLEATQNITTYTVGVINNSGANTCKPDYPALLTTMAKYGGGRYFQTDAPASVKDAIQAALNEIQAVNSVFASASLPVSTNAQGTYENQVFIGMFRPDARATPRWLGNLKQYQFVFNATGDLQLGDAAGTAALVAGTGFFSPNARSFWTSNTGGPTGGFFVKDSKPVADAFDSPDGEHVEKGGAAQVARNSLLTVDYAATPVGGPRRVYTYCPGGSPCNGDLTASVNRFAPDNAAITAAMLDDTVAKSITSIARGSTAGTESTATVTTASAHGFSAGDTVTITGAQLAYNGSKVVKDVPSTTQFTFDVTVTTAASVAMPSWFSITNRAGLISCSTACTQAAASMSRSGTTVTATITTTGGSQATRNAAAALFATSLTSVQVAYTGPGTVDTTEADYVGTFTVTGTPARVDNTVTFTFSISTSPATPATLTSATASRGAAAFDRTTLINWVRGQDNKSGDELGPGSPVNVRPSIHGDVVHSQPAVINYGGGKVVVFYGANDGMFRAINGSQTGSTTFGSTAVPAGGELWSLVLPEHYGQLNRLRENGPKIKLGASPIAGATPKDFFVDGSPGLYQRLKADGTIDKAYLFLTMRRGGRFMYAIDVTEPMTPTVKWVVKAGAAGTAYAELGQTWSRPRVIAVKGYANPLIVFGAGYDANNQDLATPTIGGDTMGRGVFALDVEDGSVAWKVTYGSSKSCPSATYACTLPDMKWSIPADITPVDRDLDGYTDRLYAADTGGNVWRIDLQDGTAYGREKWSVQHFAALGCDAGMCTSGVPRKFFYPPNVFLRTSSTDPYDLVGIGSGDREHPLISDTQAVAVKNRFFVMKDVNTALAPAASTTSPITSGASSPGGLIDVTASATGWNGTRQGFYLELASGEQVVNASLTLAGTTFFGTNQPVAPGAGICTSGLGVARSYAIDVTTGLKGVIGYNADGTAIRASSISRKFDGGGMPPSPVAGVVNVRNANTNQIEQAAFCVGCGLFAVGQDAASSLGAEGIGGSNNQRTQGTVGFQQIRRNYWYRR